jgi:hypothetical protein
MIKVFPYGRAEDVHFTDASGDCGVAPPQQCFRGHRLVGAPCIHRHHARHKRYRTYDREHLTPRLYGRKKWLNRHDARKHTPKKLISVSEVVHKVV